MAGQYTEAEAQSIASAYLSRQAPRCPRCRRTVRIKVDRLSYGAIGTAERTTDIWFRCSGCGATGDAELTL